MPNGQKKTAHAGRENIRYGVAFLILLILLVIFLAMNVCIGTVNIPVAEIPKILSGHGADETFSDIVMGIRFPRALAAAILGGALALSGYLLQTFFHNCQSIYSWNFFGSQAGGSADYGGILRLHLERKLLGYDSGGICGSYDLYGIRDSYVQSYG